MDLGMKPQTELDFHSRLYPKYLSNTPSYSLKYTNVFLSKALLHFFSLDEKKRSKEKSSQNKAILSFNVAQ